MMVFAAIADAAIAAALFSDAFRCRQPRRFSISLLAAALCRYFAAATPLALLPFFVAIEALPPPP